MARYERERERERKNKYFNKLFILLSSQQRTLYEYLLGMFITFLSFSIASDNEHEVWLQKLQKLNDTWNHFENIFANENLKRSFERRLEATFESLRRNKLNHPSARQKRRRKETMKNQCFNYTRSVGKKETSKRSRWKKNRTAVCTWVCQTENSESVAQIIYTVNKSRSVCTKHLNFSEKTRLVRRVRRASAC